MIVEPTIIPDVLLLTPPRFVDERGFFSETWNERRFVDAGIRDRSCRTTMCVRWIEAWYVDCICRLARMPKAS